MKNSTVRVPRRLTWARRPAFTLIELMAVMLVIALLVALTMSVSSYVHQQATRSRARAQIAAIGAALEMYKSDFGYYPATGPERISADGSKEATNNWFLYRALSGAHGKAYMAFQTLQIRINPAPNISSVYLDASYYTNSGTIYTNYAMGWSIPGVTNIYDPWNNPYVYYNSPGTTNGLMSICVATSPEGYNTRKPGTGYTVGGQVNIASYDLFSYGPDGYTYVSGTTPNTNCAGTFYNTWFNRLVWADTTFYPWTNKTSAADDINNWSR